MKQTKQALAESLKELLKRKPLERITVKDIVSGCGINRQSFYYHFCDVYDLMEWTLEEDIRKFFEALSDPPENWQEKVRLLFRYFYENRLMLLRGYEPKSQKRYRQVLEKWFLPILEEQMALCPQVAGVPQSQKEFLVKVYAWGFASLCLEWVERGLPDENKVNLEYYFLLLTGSLSDALDRFLKVK